MKKRYFFVLLFCVLCFVFLNSVLVSADTSDFQGIQNDTEKLTSAANNLTNANWSEIAMNWKAKIVNGWFFSGINSFLMKISVVFNVIFGADYSLSVSFYFVVVLWFWFFFQFKRMFGLTSIFSKWVGILISLALNIGIAQIGLYNVIAEFFSKLVFLPKSPVFGIFIFIILNAFLIIISMIMKNVSILNAKGKEKMEKEKEKINRGVLDTYVGELKKGFDE